VSLGTLASLRAQLNGLRERVTAQNASHPVPEHAATRVVVYIGQAVLGSGVEEERHE
jgi:hypothetical protein